jgi:cellulase/cellobiase CelA1
MSKAKQFSVRQRSRNAWLRVGLSCIAAAGAVACNQDYQNDESTPAVQALAGRGISVSLTYKSDWKSGYCSRVLVTNTGTESLQDWQIVINLGQARLTQVNNANSNLVGARMTVTSPNRNSRIAAGDSASFDFCAANAGGSDYHPTLESVAAASNRPGYQKG